MMRRDVSAVTEPSNHTVADLKALESRGGRASGARLVRDREVRLRNVAVLLQHHQRLAVARARRQPAVEQLSAQRQRQRQVSSERTNTTHAKLAENRA